MLATCTRGVASSWQTGTTTAVSRWRPWRPFVKLTRVGTPYSVLVDMTEDNVATLVWDWATDEEEEGGQPSGVSWNAVVEQTGGADGVEAEDGAGAATGRSRASTVSKAGGASARSGRSRR